MCLDSNASFGGFVLRVIGECYYYSVYLFFWFLIHLLGLNGDSVVDFKFVEGLG